MNKKLEGKALLFPVRTRTMYSFHAYYLKGNVRLEGECITYYKGEMK